MFIHSLYGFGFFSCGHFTNVNINVCVLSNAFDHTSNYVLWVERFLTLSPLKPRSPTLPGVP